MRGDISIQLYTIREQLAQDFEGSLHKLAQIGYRWIEPFHGAYKGRSAGDFRTLLSSLNLKISSSHANITILKEHAEETIKYLADAGCPHLVCSWADFSSEREVFDTAEFFNELGGKARDAGMSFSYHNHNHEFVQYSGRYILDLLMEHTDPALVGLELDVYWAAKAGINPVSYQEKWNTRSVLLHCKDMDGGPEKDFAAVGEGILDFSGILKAASKVRYFVVEQDRCDDPFRCAEISFRSLTTLLQEI
jgi:sugar phosphate isomerase/epimerase